jgi:hypothetical protein
MRMVCMGLALAILVGCAESHRRVNGTDVIAMKKQGLSDPEIIRHVEAADVKLMLTDDDVVSLIGAGFTEETINALLKRARDIEHKGHH